MQRGEASAAGGAYAMGNFKFALGLAKQGAVDAICFTPFNKQALRLAGNPFEDEMQLAASELGFDLWQERALRDPAAMGGWLRSFGLRIGGGTSEIQRNIIGERVLALPREPRR